MILDLENCHCYARRESALKVLDTVFPASAPNPNGHGLIAVTDLGRYVPVVITNNPELIAYCLHSKAVGGKVFITNLPQN